MHWKCGVCGYIHNESEPPAPCPVCGAPTERFRQISLATESASNGHDTNHCPSSSSTDAHPSSNSNLRWRCTVCGYVHTGPEPPETCPVCGADSSKFVPLTVASTAKGVSPNDPGTKQPAKLSQSTPPTQPEGQKTGPENGHRQWRCTVCNHLHDGDSPPATCPVCGSIADKFLEIQRNKNKTASSNVKVPSWIPEAHTERYTQLAKRLSRYHAHPIAVHLPNGLAPIATLFLLLALLFHSGNLERAAYYNMIVVMLSMPVVLFTGYIDWHLRYGRRMSPVFRTKIACGIIVTALAVVLVFWRMLNPAIALPGSDFRSLYFFTYLALVGAGGVAGFNGGKLVFPKK